jgi:HPt (histidine-containing phosphotransfer) domain-containing protein
MDHMMPGMDGIEAVRIIRNEIDSDYAKNVPIIALTANALKGNDTMFLENGFQAFLSKPIDILRLDQALNRWVRNKEKEKKMAPERQEASVPQDRESVAKTTEKKNRFLETMRIPDFNAASGLIRFENDVDIYATVLESYVQHAPQFIQNARDIGTRDTIDDEALDSYRIAVHSLKGSSRSVGAEKLGDMAEKLENAARQKDMVFVFANSIPFVKAGEKLIMDLASVLGTMDKEHDTSKPETDAPDPLVFAELKQAAENYDMAAVKTIIATLDSYRYTSRPDLVQWLREKADISDFEAIIKYIH